MLRIRMGLLRMWKGTHSGLENRIARLGFNNILKVYVEIYVWEFCYVYLSYTLYRHSAYGSFRYNHPHKIINTAAAAPRSTRTVR